MTTATAALQGVEKHYKKFTLGPIDLVVPAGSIVGLVGENGAGKTTTLNAIIHLLKEAGEKVFLAAPTGRAAKRMSELTGEEAKTIRRTPAGWSCWAAARRTRPPAPGWGWCLRTPPSLWG